MARLLEQFVEAPRPCAYLPLQRATLEHRIMLDVTPQEWDALLVRGWRRFGPVYFRPECRLCQACVSLRIPTATFQLSRSQRRARRACEPLEIEVGSPKADAERLALYHAWHSDRERERRWSPSPISMEEYFVQFAYPHPCAREVAFYARTPLGRRLVGLGLSDESPLGWSAAYFFYSPEMAKSSLGTANILFQIELARQRGIPHVYLGYRVENCVSLKYKSSFRPYETLLGRPGDEEAPRWVPHPDS